MSNEPLPEQHPPQEGHGAITSVGFVPWPEGPPLVLDASHASFTEAIAKLPNPLPQPVAQAPQCCQGGSLFVIEFSDRYRVIYGPCHLPTQIEDLRSWFVATGRTRTTT